MSEQAVAIFGLQTLVRPGCSITNVKSSHVNRRLWAGWNIPSLGGLFEAFQEGWRRVLHPVSLGIRGMDREVERKFQIGVWESSYIFL